MYVMQYIFWEKKTTFNVKQSLPNSFSICMDMKHFITVYLEKKRSDIIVHRDVMKKKYMYTWKVY
jgi:hypothetical protein